MGSTKRISISAISGSSGKKQQEEWLKSETGITFKNYVLCSPV